MHALGMHSEQVSATLSHKHSLTRTQTHWHSYYLYSITRPDRNGVPIVDLSSDEHALPEYSHDIMYTGATQLKIDRALTKVVSELSPLKPIITDRLRSLMKAKLWRMGKALNKKSSKQRKTLLQRWQGTEWEITLKPLEARAAMVQEKENLQARLEKEQKASAKLAKEVEAVMKVNVALIERDNQRAKMHTSDPKPKGGLKRKARKPWGEYTQQHKRQKLQQVKDAVESVLCDDQLKVLDITVKDKRSDTTLNLADSRAVTLPMDDNDDLNLLLYAKEKFRISDAAYHELSMLYPMLPRSCQLKKRTNVLNEQWEIFRTPEGTIGVQQSLKKKLAERVEYLFRVNSEISTFRLSKVIRVKLTGDGTNIGKLHVVAFGFTIPEPGMSAKSAAGNHPVCILKDKEDYEQLRLGLSDIVRETADIQKNGLCVQGTTYHIDFLLGGDWKFLACVCGLDNATSTYSCIWCTCSKDERHLDKEWSITDTEQGARTVQNIKAAAKLPKRSVTKYNCSHPPLFDIPMHKVIIDNLHLFLRISDLLINLLIADIRRLDGIEKVTSSDLGRYRNLTKYVELLSECKIPFHFYVCKDTKKLKWCDLNGPEKHRLLGKIDFPQRFPSIPNIEKIQFIWTEFRRLNSLLSSDSFSSADITTFAEDAKLWQTKFLHVYQTKNITPYMHAFVSHVPEFLKIHGAIAPYTQQGLEKLNDSLNFFTMEAITETCKHYNKCFRGQIA